MSYILSNRGRMAVVDLSDLPDSPTYEAAMVRLNVRNADGTPGTEILASGYITSLKRAWKVNHKVERTLSGISYYTQFGKDYTPLQLQGLLFNETCQGSPTSQYTQLKEAFDTYKADTYDPTYVSIFIDGTTNDSLNEQTGLLVGASLQWQLQQSGVPLFHFGLTFVITDDFPGDDTRD